MAYCRSKPGVVLVVDSADSPFDVNRVAICEVLDHVEFYVAAPFTCESLNRIGIPDCLQCFAHQYQSFLLDIDDSLSRLRVRVIWETAYCTSGRARHIQ